jgi:hypothetical protein
MFPLLVYLVSGSKIIYFQISRCFENVTPNCTGKSEEAAFFLTFAVTQKENSENC